MIYLLLVFVPLSFILNYLEVDSVLVFAVAALAIVPLAGIMARATDELAKILGTRWGGLLNVSLGNATELIISLFALRAGLPAVVKAAITGSILNNILLVLGLSFFLGGLARGERRFDQELATVNGIMLMLAVISLFIPAIFNMTSPKIKEEILGYLSIGVGIILFLTYAGGVFFALKERQEIEEDRQPGSEEWPLKKSLPVLLMVTVLVAWQSEILVNSIRGVEEALGLSRIFIGVIILPIIANIAENTTAITMAIKDNMELSLTIAIGSSIQIALFLVPVLIFLSHALGHPMNLLFNVLEISALASAVIIANLVYLRGRSNWVEGLQLLAAYLILAMAFFFA